MPRRLTGPGVKLQKGYIWIEVIVAMRENRSHVNRSYGFQKKPEIQIGYGWRGGGEKNLPSY